MDVRQPAEYPGDSRRPENEVNPNDGDLARMFEGMPINKKQFVTEAPTEPFKLTYIDVTCLVINRMIGTGIFDSPKAVMMGVGSPGIAILFWLCGCVYALAGAQVYVEYGLNVPRYVIDGVEQSVPRSGGDLHYLQYVFPWPRYKKGIVMLSGVLYGISFICIGNMAGNCINCAFRLVEAANPGKKPSDLNEGTIRGIAIVIAIFPCLIHAFSRRGGILLNNLLAFIKVLMLIFMIIATWAVAGGPKGVEGIPDVPEDLTHEPEPYDEGNAHAQAFLSIIFAFSGFNQPNYVLGEIKHPRRTYPRSMWWGVSLVSILYMAVNICYMIVVPKEDQQKRNVAQAFFYTVFDATTQQEQYTIKRAVNAFLAISAFGNIVVMTYTAARMKQEIAKQGFLPFTSFFAKNRDVSLGKFLMWLERGERKSTNQPVGNGQGYDPRKVAGNRKKGSRFFMFLNPSNHREKTPVGALVLHFASCIVLILATYNSSAENAYAVLSRLVAYLTSAWFGFFLSLGILILRFRGPPTTQPTLTRQHREVLNQGTFQRSWAWMTRGSVNSKLSILCGGLYLVGNLYPIITGWVPYNLESPAWWVVPVISWCVLSFAALWFLGFIGVAKYKCHTGRSKFIYLCEPEFGLAESSEYRKRSGGCSDLPSSECGGRGHHGGLVLLHETIYTGWEGIETEQMFSHGADITDDILHPAQSMPVHGGEKRRSVDPAVSLYEDTDFPEFAQQETPVHEPELVSNTLSTPVQNDQNGAGRGLP
ncbi:amino acid permease-domain-containing protein [Fusarium venenatum]|uniref:amino acid permease-domain-containing protein n=1 Tax=Fusarium venenatum TaxID=56646 RepID=UPI001DE0E02B|nr:amino acid permease-domain-containing protein [Fusarium venenatum]